MLPIPRSFDEIDAAWLTAVLRRAGTIVDGTVTAFEVTRNQTWNVAETAFVSAHVGEASPLALFVKLRAEPDPLEHLFPGEHAFYVDHRTADLPIVRCHAALRDSATGATCLVLDDLRETHVETSWPLLPNEDRCRAAMEAFARIHGHGWNAGPSAALRDTLSERERRIQAHVEGLLPAFIDTLGDRLPPARRALFEAAVGRTLALKTERLGGRKPICGIHGDAHFWNLLYPRDPERHDCVVIDWEDWRVDFAASDLALAIAMHWSPERRARLENSLLRYYHDALLARGVTGYGSDDLARDYRVAHICNAVIPVFQFEAANSHASWWPNLERWFLAFDDLGVRRRSVVIASWSERRDGISSSARDATASIRATCRAPGR